MKETIAIIGAGNMGAAFYRGMREHLTRVRLNVCDRNADKLSALDAEHPYADPAKAIAESNVVLLAVKPQSAKELLTALSPTLSDRLIISIMNGVTISTLQQLTRSRRVIRAMPNLPSQLGLGFTGWIASPDVTKKERALALEIFDAVGEQMELENEDLINVIGGLSGSGPAYFFFLAELLAAKAVKEGFTDREAARIARQTLIGSGALLASAEHSPAEWRAAVSSKGGSTEMATMSFQNDQLDAVVSRAIDAAIARSKELNS